MTKKDLSQNTNSLNENLSSVIKFLPFQERIAQDIAAYIEKSIDKKQVFPLLVFGSRGIGKSVLSLLIAKKLEDKLGDKVKVYLQGVERSDTDSLISFLRIIASSFKKKPTISVLDDLDFLAYADKTKRGQILESMHKLISESKDNGGALIVIMQNPSTIEEPLLWEQFNNVLLDSTPSRSTILKILEKRGIKNADETEKNLRLLLKGERIDLDSLLKVMKVIKDREIADKSPEEIAKLLISYGLKSNSSLVFESLIRSNNHLAKNRVQLRGITPSTS